MSEDNHGRYIEIKEEKEVIQITAKAKLSVVHFFHEDFEKCKTMDQKLDELSSKYFSTRFLRVNVANVPWLVTRLEIKVLPCVVGFLDGVLKERIIGFEGITDKSSNEINLLALESRLKLAGVVVDEGDVQGNSTTRRAVFSTSAKRHSAEESDWDD